MTTDSAYPLVIPPRLASVALLGRLLQRLEQQPRDASPQQYRDVVRRLHEALADVPDDEASICALQALLGAWPALREVYENLHYARAGLCRSPIDTAARAELAARDVIARAAGR
jgi:hypothetical protein